VKRVSRLVVSGLDGGLLDPITRDYDAARPAIAALARVGIPLVLCSSRTRQEVTLVSRVFGLGAPVVVENGAALLVPDGHLRGGVPGGERDGEWWVLRLAPPRETLRRALAEAAEAASVRPRLCSDMTPAERRERDALPAFFGSPPAAREHTEPFVLDGEDAVAALALEASRRGLRLARGQGCWHLCGGADKGLALRTLLALYEREGELPRSIGLGSWPIDLPMLRSVHRPVVLPMRDGTVHPELARGLRPAERAWQGGSRGWSDAVIAAITGRRLPPLEAPPSASTPIEAERRAAS
jgi:mannosyl-3-phosphoglycerate phosphatase family protein